MEPQFALILGATTEHAIIATDPTGVITLFNTGAERMLGYRTDEVVGTLTLLRFHEPAEIAARAAELGLAPGLEAVVAATRRGGPRRASGRMCARTGHACRCRSRSPPCAMSTATCWASSVSRTM